MNSFECLVLLETANDNVPVIAEWVDPADYGSEWAVATDEQYDRYVSYWDAWYDAWDAGEPTPDAETWQWTK